MGYGVKKMAICGLFNFMKILKFLKDTTGLDYEIHVVQETAAH